MWDDDEWRAECIDESDDVDEAMMCGDAYEEDMASLNATGLMMVDSKAVC